MTHCLSALNSNHVQDLDLDELINLDLDFISNIILFRYKTRLGIGGGDF